MAIGGWWFWSLLCWGIAWMSPTTRSVPASSIPEYWPSRTTTSGVIDSAEAFALGRALFYDPILSKDSTVACATCHQPQLAFSDGLARSIGVNGRRGKRSAPSLANVGFQYHGFFWDGRVATLEEQSLHPFRDSLEMDLPVDEVISRLDRHPGYSDQFARSFGSAGVDSVRIQKVLAHFERELVSANSRYDRMAAGVVNYSVSELRGWAMFFDASMDVPHAECSHCHVDPLFANPQFQNNGLATTGLNDPGRSGVTGNPYDRGKFKVPSLRNVALTAPYMHDGRFNTLDAVLDHYISGGHPGLTVSPNVRPLNLDEHDKADLLAFLHTLTDSTFISHPELQNPFKSN